jgi:aminoglycoside phosphotransferase (APT) family kinase protein
MRSKTKPAIDPDTIGKLFENFDITGVTNIAPLGAGEYNSVYAVSAGSKAYVIKIAPQDPSVILTYERDMMAQEVYYYGLMANQAKIRVPKIYHVDFTRTVIPSEYFIMERLPGKQMDQVELTEDQKAKVEAELAVMVARMHSVKGDQFGYRQNGLHQNWHLALQSMVENLIADCKALGKRTRKGEKLLEYIDIHRQTLEQVDSALINFDIWPPNIICDRHDGAVNLAWIDPERCLWGDRIADFVPLDFMNMSLDKKTTTFQAYNRTADQPIVVGDGERIRYAIMLGYLALIMEVEKYARYSLLHYGYWRNLSVCKMIYDSCFKQLAELTA